MGTSEIELDPQDSLCVIAVPLEGTANEGTTRISLRSHKILGLDGMLLFARTGWPWAVTVYKEQSGDFLFLVGGERIEERLRILVSESGEEKSETVLERICIIGAVE